MDSTNTLPQVVEGSNAVLEINQLFDDASPAIMYGRDADLSVDLLWAYLGGRWGVFLIAGDAETLGASTTTYMVVDKSDGTVSFATTLTNWNNTVDYCRAYKIVTGASAVTSWEDHRGGPKGTLGGSSAGGDGVVETITGIEGVIVDSTDPANPVVKAKRVAIPIAVSDESSPLVAGTAIITYRIPFAFTLTEVRACVTTAPTGAALIVDVNEGGTSVLSTKLSIDAGEDTSTTAASAAVISDSSLADDAKLTIDIDQIGSSFAGAGLKVTLIGYAT